MEYELIITEISDNNIFKENSVAVRREQRD
jgi:hypothetical protein